MSRDVIQRHNSLDRRRPFRAMMIKPLDSDVAVGHVKGFGCRTSCPQLTASGRGSLKAELRTSGNS